MAQHGTQFEATQGGMVLTNAILLYQGKAPAHRSSSEGSAFASFHDVEDQDGKPMIGAGAPMTRQQLQKWTNALGKSKTAAPEILPGNVLVAHREMLAWWVPEQVRLGYFALTDKRDGLKALAERTVVQVPYPAHLFIATRRGLGVFALPTNERPTAETVVLYSPILNVFIEGHLCWGSVAKPKTLTIASMAEYERAVFDSWSTHPNNGQEMTVKGKGGLVRLWDDLAARKATRFPVKRLKPFTAGRPKGEPFTLGKLIAGFSR